MSQAPEADFIFLSLVLNIQAAALQQMGKMVNPVTGELERSLEGAKQSIDLLECLERKTQGNLSKDEERAMQEALTTLRLNFVDELKKDQAGGEPKATATEDPDPSPAAATEEERAEAGD